MDEQTDDISFFLTDDLSRCHNCGKGNSRSKLKRCAGCEIVKYCGKECQKKAWPEHKLGCRYKSAKKGPGAGAEEHCTPVERRARLLQSMGFPTAMSLAHTLKDWAEAHRWSFTTMTKTAVLLEGGPDALQLDSGTPQFMSYVVTPNQRADGNPADAFRVEMVGFISAAEYKGGNTALQQAWEDAEPGRRRMDASFRKDGDPSFAGVISVIYHLKDTDMVVHNQHPVWRARNHGPLDEWTKTILGDLLALCKGCINAGVALRTLTESSNTPFPGVLTRTRKTWTWHPLFARMDTWNHLARALSSYRVESGLLPQEIFKLVSEL